MVMSFSFCQPGILASQPGMEPTHPAMEAEGPNYWTAREIPDNVFFLFCFSTSDHFIMVFIVLLMPFLYPPLRCELSAELHPRLSFHWSLYSWTIGFSPLLSLPPVAWQLSSNVSNLPLSWVLISYIWRSSVKQRMGGSRREGQNHKTRSKKKLKHVSISLSQYSGREIEIVTIFLRFYSIISEKDWEDTW